MTRLERILAEADRALERLERAQVARLTEHLNLAYRRLKAELSRLYSPALAELSDASRAYREARARVLLQELRASLSRLEPTLDLPVDDAQRIGLENAEALLRFYEPGAVTAAVQLERAAMVAQNAQARLHNYAEEAVRRIEAEIVDAFVRGSGVSQVTRQVARVIRGEPSTGGGLRYRAERIARTEIVSASNEARRETYRANGVEYVQWYATQDERTCRYCGARHGNAYERDEAVVPAHPMCRCFLAPFRPEWLERGLIDAEWWAESQREVEALMAERGVNPSYGASPFEKANGRGYPKAAWTPRSGWT